MPGVGIWPSDLMIPFKPAYSFSWALELFGREPVSCRSSLAGSKEPFSWGSICTSQPILWWCLHSTPGNSIPAAPSSSGMLYCHTQAKGQAPSQPMLRLIQASQEYQTSQDKIKSQTRFWRIHLQTQTCGGARGIGIKLSSPSLLILPEIVLCNAAWIDICTLIHRCS